MTLPAPQFRWPRVFLWLEFSAFYILLPLALLAVADSGRRVPMFEILWLAAGAAAFWLVRKRGWQWASFVRPAPATRGQAAALALRCIFVFAALWLALYLFSPGKLWQFPLRRPLFWLLIMVAYPAASVLPQGILFRALFFERYAVLFGRAANAAAVLCFSFTHVFFRNPFALLLTLAGGVVFVWQYRRTGSLAWSNIEHALYGDLVFTIGWGAYLYAAGSTLSAGGAVP